MAIRTLEEMFQYELADVYGIEQEVVGLLDDLSAASSNDELAAVLADHREETRTQLERLESVFDACGVEPEQRASATIEGLLTDRRQFEEVAASQEMEDLYNIGIALRTERIEITAYESLLMLAEQLEYGDEVVAPLEQNHTEEEAARSHLKSLKGDSKVKSAIERLMG